MAEPTTTHPRHLYRPRRAIIKYGGMRLNCTVNTQNVGPHDVGLENRSVQVVASFAERYTNGSHHNKKRLRTVLAHGRNGP